MSHFQWSIEPETWWPCLEVELAGCGIDFGHSGYYSRRLRKWLPESMILWAGDRYLMLSVHRGARSERRVETGRYSDDEDAR